MGAVQDLFSDAVVAVETRVAVIDDSLLWPDEAAQLGNVVEGRRWSFTAGRRCARLAITGLGELPGPVLTGEKREPLWPTGIVGSITHTDGYAAAAVARAGHRAGVGIDAEPDEGLPDGVLRRIAFDSELDWLHRTDPGEVGVAHPDRLLFCAKEAVYKVWFPLTRSWLGFEDARIDVESGDRTFVARIAKAGPVRELRGRYGLVGDTTVATIEVGT